MTEDMSKSGSRFWPKKALRILDKALHVLLRGRRRIRWTAFMNRAVQALLLLLASVFAPVGWAEALVILALMPVIGSLGPFLVLRAYRRAEVGTDRAPGWRSFACSGGASVLRASALALVGAVVVGVGWVLWSASVSPPERVIAVLVMAPMFAAGAVAALALGARLGPAAVIAARGIPPLRALREAWRVTARLGRWTTVFIQASILALEVGGAVGAVLLLGPGGPKGLASTGLAELIAAEFQVLALWRILSAPVQAWSALIWFHAVESLPEE